MTDDAKICVLKKRGWMKIGHSLSGGSVWAHADYPQGYTLDTAYRKAAVPYGVLMKRAQSGTERALIAVGLSGSAAVVATDGDWIGTDVDNISDSADDVGLNYPSGRPGLYLWTGTGRLVDNSAPDMPYEPDVEYSGTFRPVRPDELPELLAMEPPSWKNYKPPE